MPRTKTTPRRTIELSIFVPRPQGGPSITDRVRDRQLTDAIASSGKIKIVNRTKKPRFKIKKLLPERRIVQIKKDGQVVKTINVHRKSFDFNGIKAKHYQFYCKKKQCKPSSYCKKMTLLVLLKSMSKKNNVY